MSEYDTSNAAWITSRACNNSACVQVAHLARRHGALRDSKDISQAAAYLRRCRVGCVPDWRGRLYEFDVPVS